MPGEPAADVAVSVDGVSKSFKLPIEQMHTLKERVLHPRRGGEHRALEALQDVSFEVRSGEVFGIVGRNGSGKSTLMKCLAGIYGADAGEMWLRGRMAPFIELGVGFNPDLTAHDNVLINAVMLGLSPAEARERYDAILDFAELREFADLKLKNYSSGMQVRLAFGVMVHVDADLLLIDEVLAVGDAAFQQKCYDTLSAARAQGKTILLVTHDMAQVERFCDRAMLIDRGVVQAVGPAVDVAQQYLALNFPREVASGPMLDVTAATGEGGAQILDTWFIDPEHRRTEAVPQGAGTAMALRVQFTAETAGPVFEASIADAGGVRTFVITTEHDNDGTVYAAGEQVLIWFSFDNWLAPGRYSVTSSVLFPGGAGRTLARHEDACSFVVTGVRKTGGLVDIPTGHQIQRVTEAVESLRDAIGSSLRELPAVREADQ